MSDVDVGMHACRDRVANGNSTAYLYSASEGLGHSVVPGLGNPYSTAILQETFRFLVTGSVIRENMLSKQGDPCMPPSLNLTHDAPR
jgi:hypothetical protein